MRRGLNTSVIASVVLHVLVFLLSIFGLPWIDKPVELPQPVAVEIVDISEMTTRTADANPTPAPKPDKPPEPVKTPPPPPKASTPPPPQAAPETPPAPKAPPEDIKAPEPPKVEPIQPREAPKPPDPVKPLEPAPAPTPTPPPPPKPEPKKEEPPKPTPPKPAPAKEEPKKPAEQPKKEQPVKTAEKPPEKPKDTSQNFDSLLKNLLNVPDQAKTDQPTKANAKPTQTAEAQPDAPLANRLTMSETDAIRAQMAKCWSIPAGAQGVQDMSVDIQITLDSEARVKSATVVNSARMATDRAYRTLAESAIRAVSNPACQPLKLPKDKIETYHSFIMGFDPQDVL
ncbi:hypothetical protein [Radicibacter daui]|uniref:hypothetical protein n=1 Tax=Radicibacter daui TaxID=3064829 RepID=UPI004046FF40